MRPTRSASTRRLPSAALDAQRIAQAARWRARHVCTVTAVLSAVLTSTISSNATAGAMLDRVAAQWSNVHDYSATIVSHEVLDGRREDRVLRYAFRKPEQARLDLLSGTKAVATIVWNGGDSVTAYRSGFSFFKLHGSARDPRFTSLRGNGVLTPNLGEIVACFQADANGVSERPGPVVTGEATTEIALDGAHAPCSADSAIDAHITRDVIDVSPDGIVLARRRYEGPSLVEEWLVTQERINAGLDDALFR